MCVGELRQFGVILGGILGRFLESGGEPKGRGFLVRHHNTREVDGGSFGKGWKLFFNSNEGGGVVKVLVHRGTGGGDGGLVRYVVQHLSVCGAGLFVAKVSMLSAMNVCEMPLMVGLKDCELVGCIGVGAE